MQEVQEVYIKTEFIKISQFLKLAGAVGQGSDAKALILEGAVLLNGEKVSERGKKVYNGDIVEIKGMFKAKALVKGD